MTYATGTAVDLEDLLANLNTFAQTTHGGWSSAYPSNPDTTNGWFELNRTNISFSMKYPVVEAPVHASVHHAFAPGGAGVAPGAHTTDSNSGYNTTATGHTNANLLTERCVRDIGNGPFPTYDFFGYDDPAGHFYVYAAVQVAQGMFRHIVMGLLKQEGDGWDGGEFVSGHYMDAGTTSPGVDFNHQLMLDGLGSVGERQRSGTVRLGSGFPNQGLGVFGVSVAAASGSLLTDTDGNPRLQIHGGYRAGVEVRSHGNPTGNSSSGQVPGVSIPAYYRDPTALNAYSMGVMPDVRQLNIRNFNPRQTLALGTLGDWMIFPMSIKTTANVANRSQYCGLMYRVRT